MLLVAFALVACAGGEKLPTYPAGGGGGGGVGGGGGGGGSGGGGGPGLTGSVSVSDNSFTPTSVTILATGTVTWNWTGGGYGTAHNVTFTDADSGDMTTGSWMKSFPNAGTYTYRCTNHSGMNGTVVVQ